MVFRGNREGIDRQLTANEKGGEHMVFRGNRGGIDRQLTADDEGGSDGFQREQKGY